MQGFFRFFTGLPHLESSPNEAFVENPQPFVGAHSVRPAKKEFSSGAHCEPLQNNSKMSHLSRKSTKL
jgi:hypothetical protein